MILALGDDPMIFEGENSSYVLDVANGHQTLLVREQQFICSFGMLSLSPKQTQGIFGFSNEQATSMPWFNFRQVGYSSRLVPWRRVCHDVLLSRHSPEMVNGIPRNSTGCAVKVQTFTSDDKRDCASIYLTPGAGDEDKLIAEIRDLDLTDKAEILKKFGLPEE